MDCVCFVDVTPGWPSTLTSRVFCFEASHQFPYRLRPIPSRALVEHFSIGVESRLTPATHYFAVGRSVTAIAASSRPTTHSAADQELALAVLGGDAVALAAAAVLDWDDSLDHHGADRRPASTTLEKSDGGNCVGVRISGWRMGGSTADRLPTPNSNLEVWGGQTGNLPVVVPRQGASPSLSEKVPSKADRGVLDGRGELWQSSSDGMTALSTTLSSPPLVPLHPNRSTLMAQTASQYWRC